MNLRAGRVDQVVEHLPSMCKAPVLKKKKKKRKKRRNEPDPAREEASPRKPRW
jgi:hypothetical protein